MTEWLSEKHDSRADADLPPSPGAPQPPPQRENSSAKMRDDVAEGANTGTAARMPRLPSSITKDQIGDPFNFKHIASGAPGGFGVTSQDGEQAVKPSKSSQEPDDLVPPMPPARTMSQVQALQPAPSPAVVDIYEEPRSLDAPEVGYGPTVMRAVRLLQFILQRCLLLRFIRIRPLLCLCLRSHLTLIQTHMYGRIRSDAIIPDLRAIKIKWGAAHSRR